MLKPSLRFLIKYKFFWLTILILLTISTAFYILGEKEKGLRICAEKELKRTIDEKRIVEADLREAEKKIAVRDKEIEFALDKLEREVKVRRRAEAELLLVIKERVALEAKIEELSANSENIELRRIIVKGRSRVGEVLAWDKKHKFIVISIGSINSLELGEVLSVYRNDKLIGEVQIEKVEEKTAAAVILPKWQDVEFRKKDVVRKI